MTQENFGEQQEQGSGEASYGDQQQSTEGGQEQSFGGEQGQVDGGPQSYDSEPTEQQGLQEEQQYGDSSTAVSPDTQYADPSQGSDGGSFGGESAQGESAQGDEDTFTGSGQDAEAPTSGYGDQPEGTSSQGAPAETSYGQDQDAAPSEAPSSQQ